MSHAKGAPLRDIARQPLVATAIHQVFAAEALNEARARLAGAVASLEAAAPKVALLLEDAEDDLRGRKSTALLIEQRDEWLVGRRYLSAESLAGLYATGETRRPERPAPTVREVALPTT